MTGPTESGRPALVALLVCALALSTIAAVGPVAAQDDGPPPLPAAYYGDLEINGEPADAGVVVEAEVDGEVRGSSTVGENATYGGPDAEDPKLEVDGTDGDAGENVTFYVESEDFDRTAIDDYDNITWEPETVKRIDLSAAVEFDDGDDGNSDDGNSDDGDDSGGEDSDDGDGGDGDNGSSEDNDDGEVDGGNGDDGDDANSEDGDDGGGEDSADGDGDDGGSEGGDNSDGNPIPGFGFGAAGIAVFSAFALRNYRVTSR
ncbi:hypothetical protein HALLA_00430 (plasmid) [Halostagnicola larsenii XH-48]|uniref:PGF-CTERM sorting domain-containing protein n=1 Tax=Halostagnicola larsenii XH-48 TaxID=797299 RepID=W0JTA9_9EURY|nr:hypothetical protein [Halostagnicola larsenii]AHG01789.1 hypothetical protein HALLA_00430 [Halostagnicola larsenii XH-48]